MLSGHEETQPNIHHIELAAALAADVRRHLDRLGRLRGLVSIEVGGTGAYRIALTPAASLRLTDVTALGIGLNDAMSVIDDVLAYDPEEEAAVMIVETNPVDGAILTFLIQDLSPSR